MPQVVAVVPIKELSRSKSRLSSVLSTKEREDLSLGLMRGVVSAAVESGRVRVWVVGRDDVAAQVADELGAGWVDDRAADLNGAVSDAFSLATAAGMASLYLPADLPFVTREDVAGLVEVSDGGSALTLAPARFDGGTNAIVAPLGTPFRPTLSPGSFDRHREQASELGLEVAFFDSPGIGIDIDTPEDLTLAESIEPGLLTKLTQR